MTTTDTGGLHILGVVQMIRRILNKSVSNDVTIFRKWKGAKGFRLSKERKCFRKWKGTEKGRQAKPQERHANGTKWNAR